MSALICVTCNENYAIDYFRCFTCGLDNQYFADLVDTDKILLGRK